MAQGDVDWDNSSHNPFNWPAWKKWTTMGTALWVTFIVGLNATGITTASQEITAEFKLSTGIFETAFLPVTAWNGAAALVPLVTLPLMDTYGVRYGYVTAYVLFVIFLIPQALAKNFATLIVCRVIAGALGGTVQNAADGIAANLFASHRERVLPLTLYVFVLLFGVAMGPVLGAVVEPLTWRWIAWIQLIICGATIPIVFLAMVETRGSVLLAKHNKPVVKESTAKLLTETISRSAILLTTEPTVTAFTIWSSFAFGLVFISTQSIPLVFGKVDHFAGYSGGLVQASIGIGQIIGFLGCLLQNQIYIRSEKKNTETPGMPIPEHILQLSIPSTVIGLAGGLFMYAWAIYQPHWTVLAISLALTGYAIMVIVSAASIYITDSYPGYAASAIAAVAFGENIFAAILPLAAKPMYEHLHYQWASSLLAFIALVLTLAPVVLFFKGASIRRRSRAIAKMSL